MYLTNKKKFWQDSVYDSVYDSVETATKRNVGTMV